MKGRAILPLAAAVLLMTGLAFADPPPAPQPTDADGSAVVKELEVVGHYPGPPQWTVRRGDAEVVVLGAVSPLPHTLEWNTHRFDRALDGARLVILPPSGRIGVFDAAYLLLHQGDLKLRGGELLWSKLTPEEQKRFDSLREEAKTEPKRYEHLKPAVAAMILEDDFDKIAGLSEAKPGSTVKRMAQGRHIRIESEGLPVVSLFRSAMSMDDQAAHTCFDALLTDAERHRSRARAVANAWANGDLGVLRGEYLASGADACLAGAPGLAAFAEKLTRDAQAQIDAALAKGGKTVAVIDLRVLLRANGVLDRLKAEGATIDVPRE